MPVLDGDVDLASADQSVWRTVPCAPALSEVSDILKEPESFDDQALEEMIRQFPAPGEMSDEGHPLEGSYDEVLPQGGQAEPDPAPAGAEGQAAPPPPPGLGLQPQEQVERDLGDEEPAGPDVVIREEAPEVEILERKHITEAKRIRHQLTHQP